MEIAMSWRLAEVEDVVRETRDAVSLVLDVPGWPGHRAGQHVDVRLTAEDGYQAQRSYSIASAPGDGPLVLTVQRLADGEVSSYLAGELRPGDRLELRGPIGGYFVWEPEDGAPLHLAAGGSGIVPLMAMLRHRAKARSMAPARLLYSARSLARVIYREELERLASADGAPVVAYALTHEQPSGWSGYSRFVDAEMLRDVLGGPGGGAISFVCGPTGFVEKVADALVELGYEGDRIRTERFGPTGG